MRDRIGKARQHPGALPVADGEGRTELVRRDPERVVGGGGGESSRALVRRRGVLHAPVQHRAGGDPAPAASPVRLDLLVAFTKHLIRNTCTSDPIWLSIYAAAEETGVTEDEMKLMMKSVMVEHAQRNFPEGF